MQKMKMGSDPNCRELCNYIDVMKYWVWWSMAMLAGAGAALAPVFAQTDARDVPQIWSGIFSAAQAERGRALVSARCASCHARNNPLTGDAFMLHWEGHDVGGLY